MLSMPCAVSSTNINKTALETRSVWRCSPGPLRKDLTNATIEILSPSEGRPIRTFSRVSYRIVGYLRYVPFTWTF